MKGYQKQSSEADIRFVSSTAALARSSIVGLRLSASTEFAKTPISLILASSSCNLARLGKETGGSEKRKRPFAANFEMDGNEKALEEHRRCKTFAIPGNWCK
jgi:hypothetical protein